MSFDHAVPLEQRILIASSRDQERTDFYAGGLLASSRRGIHFAPLKVTELFKALPRVSVPLTRRDAATTAALRDDYAHMLRSGGLRTFLQREFFRQVQAECCDLQRGQYRHLPKPDEARVAQEYAAYELHHRLPLSLGGTNALTNLVFIPQRLHRRIHEQIDRQTRHLAEGQSARVAIPYPEGIIRIAPQRSDKTPARLPHHANDQ